jgi:ribosomal protein S27AE
MAADPQRHPHQIKGHPEVILSLAEKPPQLITVCASCGEMRTILFLDKNRWFCSKCRIEGVSAPNLFPIA